MISREVLGPVRRGGAHIALVAGVVASSFVVGSSPTSAATTITVTSGGDVFNLADSDTTLREAVAQSANGDTIVFDASVTDVVLTGTPLIVGGNITIGDVAAPNRVSVSPASGYVASDLVQIVGNGNPTFANLELSGAVPGGAPVSRVIFATAMTNGLTLTNMGLSGGANGVAFDAQAPLTIVDSDLSNNASTAISALNATSVTVENSDLIDNAQIAAFFQFVSEVTFSGSTVSGSPIGIQVSDSSLVVEGSTLTANGSGGAGSVVIGGATAGTVLMSIEHSTLSGNVDGAPLINELGPGTITLDVDHSVISGNGTGTLFQNDVNATVTNSLVPSASLLGGSNGNIDADDPMLEPLGDNGGETLTMRPAAGSPAIDAGDPAIADAPADDQRGLPRVAGTIDIGSVELNAGMVQIEGAVEAAEADGTVDVLLTRVDGADGAISVDVASTDGTALVGDDFMAVAETVDFADGETEATLTVTLVDDMIAEDSETFTLDLTGVAADAANATSTVTITDSDPLTGVVSVADVTVDESAGTADIVVTRAEGSDGPASVSIVSIDGTALDGEDYISINEVIDWADGEDGDQVVTVTITDDDVVEGDETFTVELSLPVGVALDPAATTATVTITEGVATITPIASARIADTRDAGDTVDDLFEADGKLAAGDEYQVTVVGRAGVPADAKAAVLNVTAVGVEGDGFFTVHPCEATPPNASSLNYTVGVNSANEIIAPLSADGDICVFSSQAAHVIVDVSGYVEAAALYVPLSPSRFLDTRPAGMTVDTLFQQVGRVAAESTTAVPVLGRGGVAADAEAVVVNVTAANPGADGFLTVFPCDPAVPNASSLNVTTGVNRANELIASPSADGEICVFSSIETDIIVDVVGYLEAGSSFNAVAPARFLDTRDAGMTVDGNSQADGKVDADTDVTVLVVERGDVPADVSAVVVNVAAVAADGVGFVTVHACLADVPNASSLNYVTAVNVANELIVPVADDGTICLYTSESVHLLADVVGYFEA